MPGIFPYTVSAPAEKNRSFLQNNNARTGEEQILDKRRDRGESPRTDPDASAGL